MSDHYRKCAPDYKLFRTHVYMQHPNDSRLFVSAVELCVPHEGGDWEVIVVPVIEGAVDWESTVLLERFGTKYEVLACYDTLIEQYKSEGYEVAT